MSNASSALRAASATGPASRLSAIAPSDSDDLPFGICRSLDVGNAGDVVVRDAHGNQVTIASGPGQYHPVQVTRVLSSGTTASGLIALY